LSSKGINLYHDYPIPAKIEPKSMAKPVAARETGCNSLILRRQTPATKRELHHAAGVFPTIGYKK
jgi:hypothetical protein